MWGVQNVKKVSKKYTTNFDERLEKIASSINTKLSQIFYDNLILHSFRGFIDINQKYMIMNVQSEEISIVANKDNVYLFQIEYYTTIEKLGQNTQIDFSLSKSNEYGDEDENKQKINPDYSKYTETENSVIIDQENKIYSEKDFFKSILVHFTKGKNVIVKSTNKVESEVYSILIRYVVFNSKKNN